MAITRTIWKNAFMPNAVPAWTCPTCNKGNLEDRDNTITWVETVESENLHDHEDWDPEWTAGSFTGLLRCNESGCNELVRVSGAMKVELNPSYDGTDEPSWGYEHFLFPEYFNPKLKIFQVHPDVPYKIRFSIHESFNVYWLDVSSCANKIRQVIELVMDDYKVARKYTAAGKRREHSLHKRIEIFRLEKAEEADLLMAIKWIGNSGSHANDGLTRDDILDAYEILEHVTTKLYETDSKRLKQLSKKINKRKKPQSKMRTVRKKRRTTS